MQVAINYSGVVKPRKATYVAGIGIRPGSIWLEFIPQDVSSIFLDARFDMVCYGSITLLNVRTDKASIRYTKSGNMMELYALDERWKWQYAIIDGMANIPQPSGEIGSRFRINARNLCIELASKLGVIGYDFSLVPTNQFPPVFWQGANAAAELERLLSLYGLAVGFNPLTRIVSAILPGSGVAPSIAATHQIAVNAGVDQEDGPETIRVMGQDTKAQTFVKLEAVGYDPDDGMIKAIDELSYDTGWPDKNPLFLEDSSWTTLERNWARKSVYKWYRISGFANGLSTIPDWPGLQPQSMTDILPLDEYLVTTGVDADNRERQLRPFIVGKFKVGNTDIETDDATPEDPENTDNSEIVEAEYQLDKTEGIVRFESPIFKIAERKAQPADLWLACAFRVRHPITNLKQYYYYDLPTDIPHGFGYEVVDAPELTGIVINNFTGGDPTAYASTTTNQSTLDALALQMAELKKAQFETVVSYSILYRHIWPINLNGAVKQMRYSIDLDRSGDSGLPPAYCQAYINSETDNALATAEQRKRIRMATEFADFHNFHRRRVFLGGGRSETDV